MRARAWSDWGAAPETDHTSSANFPTAEPRPLALDLARVAKVDVPGVTIEKGEVRVGADLKRSEDRPGAAACRGVGRDTREPIRNALVSCGIYHCGRGENGQWVRRSSHQVGGQRHGNFSRGPETASRLQERRVLQDDARRDTEPLNSRPGFRRLGTSELEAVRTIKRRA